MEDEIKETETVEEVEAEAPAAPADGDAKEAREPRAKKNFKKANFKKVCLFCQEKSAINYKDVAKLRKFISEGGKILPRRMTGTCARHQREIAVAIKRARVAALLPFKAD
ncbi:MAG: 30S ribosomal protein S18 [Clostridia bacterium]|nr:30S ribosomal protein S18 [Clostridia bacterium]